MDALQKTEPVRSARFHYDSQGDLVRLIKLVDPEDVELALTMQANTSSRFEELYLKITGLRKSPYESNVDEDYRDTALHIRDPEKTLPVEDPTTILPPGMRRFVDDLGELISLTEKERVNPLFGVIQKEHFVPEIEWISVCPPRIDNVTDKMNKKLYHGDVGRLNDIIERRCYKPLLEQLKSIGSLARGIRPHFIAYREIRRKKGIVIDCFKSLDTVPEQNKLTYFNIGAKPRDEGNREYYDWRCASSIRMLGEDKEIWMEFGEPTDVRKLEEDFRKQGINLRLEEE